MTSFSEHSSDGALVARLRAEWRDLTTLHETLAAMATWPMVEPALAGVDLVGCDWRGEPPEQRDAILLGLIRLGQWQQPLASRVALQAMLPAAGRMATRLAWLPGIDAQEAAVVAGLVEAIATYPADRRPDRVAANLMHEAWHVAVRDNPISAELLVDPHQLSDPHHPGHDREQDASTELIGMLVTAVQDRVITVSDSQFLLDTAGYGDGKAYARQTGKSVAMVRKRRSELLRRLCEKFGNCGVMIHPSRTH